METKEETTRNLEQALNLWTVTYAPLYRRIAETIDALKRCQQTPNHPWTPIHAETLRRLAETLPHGSGFDAGTTIDADQSDPDRLTIYTSYHHMDQYGGYVAWTNHLITVTPSLIHGFDLTVQDCADYSDLAEPEIDPDADPDDPESYGWSYDQDWHHDYVADAIGADLSAMVDHHGNPAHRPRKLADYLGIARVIAKQAPEAGAPPKEE